MSAITLTERFYRGQTFEIPLTITDDDGGPTDLTGATLTAVLSTRRDTAGTVVWTKTEATPATEIDVTDAAGGAVTIKGVTGDTEALTPEVPYYLDMWGHLADGRYIVVVAPGSTITVDERTAVALP